MTGRWRVRRARRKDGSLYQSGIWTTYRPDGTRDSDFESWDEAMAWATDPIARVEYFANALSSKRI